MAKSPFEKYKVMGQPVIVYDVKYNNRRGKTLAHLVINLFGLKMHGTKIMSGVGSELLVVFPLYKKPNGRYEEIFQIQDTTINRQVRRVILRQYYARMRDDGRINPFDPVFAEFKSEDDEG
jgi:DNA-binding cell septation regulator SpoVG